MTKAEEERIAQDAARRAIEETFEHFGLDVTNPLEVQSDHAFLRRPRKAYEQMGTMTKRAAVPAIVGGAIAIAVIGFKEWVKLP